MSGSELSPSEQFLVEAARNYLVDRYGRKTFKIGKAIDSNLGWRPHIHFKSNKHITIAVEVSETLYPQILRLRHADIMDTNIPIAVYCVCPEEVFLSSEGQREEKELARHGFGLLTVNSNGDTHVRHSCIPLIGHISGSEFKQDIKSIPSKIQTKLKDAYDIYKRDQGAGIKEITELVEEIVSNIAEKAINNGWLNNSVRRMTLANKLKRMIQTQEFSNAIASLGGTASYIKRYRNTSHHIPRNKKEAYNKYYDCSHGFKEGIRVISSLIDPMRNIGIRNFI